MKIALVLNDDFSMWQFRGGLIRTLLAKSFDVYVIVPPGAYVEKLSAMGAKVISVPVYRFISPIQDLKFMFQSLSNISSRTIRYCSQHDSKTKYLWLDRSALGRKRHGAFV